MARQLETTMGSAMATVTATASDTSQTLEALYGGSFVVSGVQATAALIVAETNAVRIAFNATPTQGGSPSLGLLLPANASFLITGWENLKSCSVINATNGSNGIVTIQPFAGA